MPRLPASRLKSVRQALRGLAEQIKHFLYLKTDSSVQSDGQWSVVNYFKEIVLVTEINFIPVSRLKQQIAITN